MVEKMFNNDTVNVFFSCDDGYVPFMAVTLASLKDNCDPFRNYRIRILHTGVSAKNMKMILDDFDSKDFKISFENISCEIRALSDKLHTRDYYSRSTYYRLFIPELFPHLDKALYLDSDIADLGDISELYDVRLGDNLVAAIPDGFVGDVKKLCKYVENRVGVSDSRYYFNAGVLLMNLKEMRRMEFSRVFTELLSSVKFGVAQDQDYLNAICRGRVRYVGCEWNAMPDHCHIPECDIKLAHYNLDSKPWHKEVQFGGFFWDYAEHTSYAHVIKRIFEEYPAEANAESERQTSALVDVAYSEAMDSQTNKEIQKKINAIVPPVPERKTGYVYRINNLIHMFSALVR